MKALEIKGLKKTFRSNFLLKKYNILKGLVTEVVKNKGKGDVNEPFQMQITSLEYDAHLGRYLVGKINRGTIKRNDPVILLEKERSPLKTLKVRIKLGLFWVLEPVPKLPKT